MIGMLLVVRRLKHIIEQYADGPGVLLELVQNADDAGASEISFLLDSQTYASNSVLGAIASRCGSCDRAV